MQSLSDHYWQIDLHIGAHRTGTSSLQAALHLTADKISAAGKDLIAPPVCGLRMLPNHRATLRNALKLSRKVEKEKRGFFGSSARENELNGAIDAFAEYAGKANRHLVLSEENLLSSAIIASIPSTIYPEAGQRLRLFSGICGKNVGFVFVAIRPYTDFLVSYIAMSSVYGTAKIAFQDLEEWANGEFIGWPQLVQEIRAAFPDAKVVVWPHSSFNLARRFAQLTGLDAALMPREDKLPGRNSTPSIEAMDVAIKLKRSGEVEKQKLDRIVAQYSFGKIPNKAMFFSESTIKRLDGVYEKHLSEISDQPSNMISVF